MIMKDSKGRWHVQYEKNYSICASESAAKAKLALWKGEAAPVEAVSVEELDADKDGYITKKEISVRFP